MPVIVVTMVVLAELGLITARMTGVIDDNRHGKLVGLRNLLDRFPISSMTHKTEVLALVAFPTGLNRDGVGGYAGQPDIPGSFFKQLGQELRLAFSVPARQLVVAGLFVTHQPEGQRSGPNLGRCQSSVVQIT